MFASIKGWLLAGTPAHGVLILGALYMLAEYYLPRTDSVKARSVLEGIANLLSFIPGVKKFGSPEETTAAGTIDTGKQP